MLECKNSLTCLNLPERIARFNEQLPKHVANINKAIENLSRIGSQKLPDIQEKIQDCYKITAGF